MQCPPLTPRPSPAVSPGASRSSARRCRSGPGPQPRPGHVGARVVRAQAPGRRHLLDPGALLRVGQPGQHLAGAGLAARRGDRRGAGAAQPARLPAGLRAAGARRGRRAAAAAGRGHPRPLRPLGRAAALRGGGGAQRRGGGAAAGR